MIDSSLVRKIEKAKDYAVQPDRITFVQCRAEFRGDNGNYKITYEAGKWKCECNTFLRHSTCSHVMAMQMKLQGMVPA